MEKISPKKETEDLGAVLYKIQDSNYKLLYITEDVKNTKEGIKNLIKSLSTQISLLGEETKNKKAYLNTRNLTSLGTQTSEMDQMDVEDETANIQNKTRMFTKS